MATWTKKDKENVDGNLKFIFFKKFIVILVILDYDLEMKHFRGNFLYLIREFLLIVILEIVKREEEDINKRRKQKGKLIDNLKFIFFKNMNSEAAIKKRAKIIEAQEERLRIGKINLLDKSLF